MPGRRQRRKTIQAEMAPDEPLHYRVQRLADATPHLAIPSDFPRTAVQRFRAGQLPISLSPALVVQVRHQCQQVDVTSFMFLLTAFQTVLLRYSDQEDLIVGVPAISSKDTSNSAESADGAPRTMMALRTDFGGDPTFIEALQRVRDVCLEALDHQDVPFEQVAQAMWPDQDVHTTPLFQVYFSFESFKPSASKEENRLASLAKYLDLSDAPFDLALYLVEDVAGWQGIVRYNAELFAEATVQRLVGHYALLLANAVAHPQQRLSKMHLLSEEEQVQLVMQGDPISTPSVAERCLHQVFEEQTTQTPDALALIAEEQQVSYRILNQRTNQLAHYLRSLGVGPEVRVAVCLPRTLDLMIGLLAILKAGGAYVPLDPAYPPERLALILSDAQAQVVLTQATLLDQLAVLPIEAQQATTQVVCVDAAVTCAQVAAQPMNNVTSGVNPGNLAYIIYTSGSTGRPKGVAIAHQNAVALVDWAHQVFTAEELAVVLASTSICFDLSIFELFVPMSGGGTVVLAENALHLQAVATSLPATHQLTLLNTVPSAMGELLRLGAVPASLRTINLAGEPLLLPLVEQIYEQTQVHRVLNLYGPSEDTTYSTWADLPVTIEQAPSIGRPISHTQAYVLDRHMQLVPMGVIGELYLGGCGVARGYLNRPEQTAERFVPNPFAEKPGERLYRTGDRVRYQLDGTLAFLGRLDHQVKVRGYRIEPGEIEAVLRRHPAVREAAVIVREDVPGDKRLVAYVAPELQENATDTATPSWIEEFVAERLHEWLLVRSDRIATGSRQGVDLGFNTSGWNSSYDGQPIPEEAMREWVDQTTRRIIELQPSRVLEIGCDTGLLLFRLAPHCTTYWATDSAPAALDAIRQVLDQPGRDLPHVTLAQRAADDFTGLEAERFDVIILNSIVQYFPNSAYLLRVLRGALQVLRPGGAIFLGDIRSLPLLEAFHTTIELERAPDGLLLEAIRRRVERRMFRENELVIAPDFFLALRQHFPEIGQVKVQLKRGRHQNELTRFRYDVSLRLGTPPSAAEILALDWQQQRFSLPPLRRLLAEDLSAGVQITDIPNARLLGIVGQHQAFVTMQPSATVGELRKAMRAAQELTVDEGVEPEVLCTLAEDLSHVVNIQWARSGALDRYDAVLRKQDRLIGAVVSLPSREVGAQWALSEFTNDPLQEKVADYLTSALPAYLREHMPGYMVPSSIVPINALPLTPNGKIDRRALPLPEERLLLEPELVVAPGTATEQHLVEIWREILGIEAISIQDNFFERGGHSLLATRVIARLREVYGVELPLRSIFEAPTIVELAARVETAQQQSTGRLEAIPLLPATREGDPPLSFAQQRLWFFDQLQPGSPLYNIPMMVRLNCSFNIVALERSFNTIIERHEALRTTFVMSGEHPMQRIVPTLYMQVPIIDLATLTAPIARDVTAESLIRQEARRPFDLSRGPLLRCTMLRLAESSYILLLTIHHSIADDWSLDALYTELTTLYDGHAQGAPILLPVLPIQYADYAIWQRQWLQGERLENQLAYWRQQLADAPAHMLLPLDFARPPVQSFAGAWHSFTLPSSLMASLRQLSQRAEVTPFMALLTTFFALLMRVTGQDDLIVGTPVANRSQTATEQLIGFLVNTLALRSDLSGDPTFVEALQLVREVCLGAYAHQEVPFEQVVQAVQPDRDLSHSPLVQVSFALQTAPTTVLTVAGQPWEPEPVETGTAKFDLTLTLAERGTELVGTFEYATDLFTSETIARLARQYQCLLESFLGEPEQRLSQAPLLSHSEQKELLQAWNYPGGLTAANTTIPHWLVHERIATQAARTPNAIAVIAGNGGGSLTYAELDIRATLLARFLQQHGVCAETLVGLCLERSLDLVVGLLGILKAGGAYVPLDPTYPPERLDFLLRDSQVALVLAQEHLRERLADGPATLICLDSEWSTIVQAAQDDIYPADQHDTTDGAQLAYLLYTSGSTGQPKGVMVSHGGLANYLHWCEQAYVTADCQGAPVHSSIGFDLTVTGLLTPLLVGQSVSLLPDEVGVEALAEALQQPNQSAPFTLVKLTPAHLDLLRLRLAEHTPLWPAAGPPHALVIGGEALRQDQLTWWQEVAPTTRLLNEYGPTEAVVGCCVYEARAIDTSGSEATAIPIGRPIPNMQLYLLDRQMQPVPIGMPGDLYIGGAQLARGYWQRPDLTAERFVPHPFSSTPGAQLYQTGDVARYLADGTFVYLGRSDQQVKLRGYRIELEEIEAILRRHPQVAESAVRVYEQRLVAYIVWQLPEQQAVEAPSTSELRSFLQGKLPEYMIPATIVPLEQLPLTSNGKLDRKALPVPEFASAGMDSAYVAPRTAIERALASIWQEVLHLPQVGIEDNFFALGGHSLLATQVASRARNALAIELPLRTIFEAPTIVGLAARIQTTRLEQPEQRPLVPISREQPLPLSYAQQGLWLLDQLDPGNPSYDMLTVLRLRGALDASALWQSLSTIIQRHETLRTTFALMDGQPMQQIAATLNLPFISADISSLPGIAPREAALQQLIAQESAYQFNLAQGPLIRLLLVRLDEHDHALLVNIHHIVSDGWSMGVFLQEWITLYTAFRTHEHVVLPSLPIQYADHAVWQRHWLRGDELQRQLAYWKQQLGDAPAVLELPTDYPRPAVQTYRGTSDYLTLPAALTNSLNRICQQEGVTLHMLLLSIFNLLLARLSGSDDIVVGSPFSSRNRTETEGLIGYFLNTLVLRTRLSDELTFRDLLGRVRALCLDAYAHQDIPFDFLIEELRPERDLSHTPLFQVFFNLLNMSNYPAQGAQQIALPGLDMEVSWPASAGSKFDITLYAQEVASEMHLELAYNTDLFSSERIRELLEQFRYLAWQVVEHIEWRIERFSLVTPRSRSLLPDPTVPLSDEWKGPIYQHFTRHARHSPEQAAVVDVTTIWTYATLDNLTNQLANYLIAQDVQRQEVIAIYAHRSAALVWAIMGILKAGAAYVILDPSYPAQRLIEYLTLAKVRGVIQIAAAGPLPETMEAYIATVTGMLRVALPEDAIVDATNLVASYSTNEPDESVVQVGPNDLACVAFTSGSTGMPKGVLQRHGSLTHFLSWQQATFGLNITDRYSMLSGLAHDPLQRDIFTPLALGATICIPMPEEMGTPGWLAAWMRREHISIANLTPAMIQLLAQALTTDATGLPTTIPSLRYAFIVGEALTQRHVASLRKLAPQVTCINHYGTTETQRAVGYLIVPEPDDEAQKTATNRWTKEAIPVGKGVQDAQVLVLNHTQQLTGVGEVGEVYMRSPHLASGYLSNEQLTQERFLANLFTQLSSDRLYRTGDLGRYLPDGNIELMGRNDQQVKLRGFRIELTEIEATLQLHREVHEATVILREDALGWPALVAYVTTEQDQLSATLVVELRRFLWGRLPKYMVPSAFVLLPALPMLPNGKVDRHALLTSPLSSEVLAEQHLQQTLPCTPLEEMLVTIWCELLGLESVGITDNFFDLGGHSLLATQLLVRIRETLQVSLSLRTLFEAPRIVDLAARIEHERFADRNQLLPAITPVPRDRPLPLSFAQERLWFLDQLEPGNPSYNVPLAMNLSGCLDIRALKESLQTLVQRHEILRGSFVESGGKPTLVIDRTITIPWREVDLRELPTDEQMVALRQHAAQEAQTPFELSQPPLMRVLLVRLAEEQQMVMVTFHHIIYDGWSAGIVLHGLAALYHAIISGQTAKLPLLPVQYADYAVWQRQWLQGTALDNLLDFWRDYLTGAPAVLNLPTDFPRPPVQHSNGARYPFTLPGTLAQALHLLSRRAGTTLYMTMLAAFQTLLYRYTGQDDVVVGTPIAGRVQSEIEGLIGLFTNTLALRGDMSGAPSFRVLLERVRENCLGAYAHQDAPFEQVVETLQPERSLSYHPIFQVLFALHTTQVNTPEMTNLVVDVLEIERDTARFDLSCEMREVADGFEGIIEYSTDLFERETIERLVQHYQTLLEGIVADPEQSISRLPLLSATERKHLLAMKNATQSQYPQDQHLHRLLEMQAQLTPNTVALMYGADVLTYQELHQRANQLAWRLRQLGVGPGVRVGVLLDRSIDLVMGLLAVLKAGGAYVPLDPQYPQERIAYVLADAQAPVLLTHTALREQITGYSETVLWIDDEAEQQALAQEPVDKLPDVGQPTTEELAYVIYTSGSTGRPKGVQIPQRALVNFLWAMQQQLGISSDDTWLAVTSISFDIAGLELWLPLLVGARLVLASREQALDGEQLQALLRRSRATIMQATPVTWRLLIQTGWASAPQLQALCGGEALPNDLAQQLAARVGALWNLYGPTETTVWSSSLRVAPSSDEASSLEKQHESASGNIPLGTPLANTQFYVLDARGELAPLGIPGELAIGGDGLARGYLGRADLTAERFVPDPFSLRPGARLYRTGDLVRYCSDGTLDYLGRADQQVKVRGYRIEPGEIEAALTAHSAVTVAVVVPRNDQSGVTQLVAYVLPASGASLDVQELRGLLRRSLPEYMLPALFIPVDVLPLTPNGKIDRKALPNPAFNRLDTAEFIAPRTSTEETVAAIWAELLQVAQVSIQDNFFQLGGHSLLATQMIALVREALAVDIPLRLIFEAPTLAGFAESIVKQELAQVDEDMLREMLATLADVPVE